MWKVEEGESVVDWGVLGVEVMGKSSWRQERRNGMRNCGRADQEAGGNDWTVKKNESNNKKNIKSSIM